MDREELLKELNHVLAPIEEQLTSKFIQPKFPVIFIVGAPRSGHTLFAQGLAASRGFAFVSNFVARFWLAPYIGARLEVALGIREMGKGQDYSSEYGRIAGWIGPHEFGNFLRRWIPFTDTHKAGVEKLSRETMEKFAQEVAALEAVYGKPVFLRNIIYGLNIDLVSKVFPQSIFIVCRRSLLHNAQSLLMGREELLGDRQVWWSLRPKEYPQLLSLSCYEQVVAQVFYTYKEIDHGLESVDSNRVVDVDYAELCASPRDQVRKVVAAVERQGCPIKEVELAQIPEHFIPQDRQRVSDEDWELLKEACQKFVEAS